MSQYARPIADIDMSIWTCNTGSDYYALLDESSPDEDTTYVYMSSGTGSPPIPTPKGVLLGTVTDPGVDTGHVITLRVRHTDDADIEWLANLWCGNTAIASPTWSSVNSQSYVDLTYTLDPTEAALITDYSQLKLYPNMTPQSCDIRVTQAYMTFPDAPGTSHERRRRGFGK